MTERTRFAGYGHTAIAAAALLVLVYVGWDMTATWSERSRLLGTALLLPALALAVATLVREARRGRDVIPTPEEARTTVDAFVALAAFMASVFVFGLLVTIPAFTILYLRYVAREPWWLAVLYAAAALTFAYVIFSQGLHVSLPGGLFGLLGR